MAASATRGAARGLVRVHGARGRDAIALSPTHSLFRAEPAHYGPYSPSSRLFLNPLYADPAMRLRAERVAARRRSKPYQPPADALIDWPKAAAAKYALLRACSMTSRPSDLRSGDAPRFRFPCVRA
jgi:4-alpha-glucanotransferase